MNALPVFIAQRIRSSHALALWKSGIRPSQWGLLLITALGLSLSACVAHRPYWVTMPCPDKPGSQDCPEAKREWSERAWNRSTHTFVPLETKVKETYLNGVKVENRPALRVIEFDDHGELWSRKQKDSVVQMLKNTKKPPLLVLYVHGWKHNASEKSGDFVSFQKLLGRLAGEKTLTSEYSLCGVYVGWRGDFLAKPYEYTLVGYPVRQLTIYNRMNAADRIANGLPFTQFISEVSA